MTKSLCIIVDYAIARVKATMCTFLEDPTTRINEGPRAAREALISFLVLHFTTPPTAAPATVDQSSLANGDFATLTGGTIMYVIAVLPGPISFIRALL